MTFIAREDFLTDPETGEVQMEENEEGVLAPMQMVYAMRGQNREKNVIELSELETKTTEAKKRGPKPIGDLGDSFPARSF